ncbi:chromatin associated protein [Roridomyces roridus]|uniref:Chromatin associated protein n=1 Tax=Roridomyces roridus TaxID=1738132 RepID=A0AAD7C7H4_9AGAR|nr:chromatin associated protein [Roridomyces roridus]
MASAADRFYTQVQSIHIPCSPAHTRPKHRSAGAPPQDGPPIFNTRALSDTLDRVKQEFEVLASELTISRDQRERYEATIAAQSDELDKIRQAVQLLEAQHAKVRQQYEYELRMLRNEARQNQSQSQSQSHSQARPTSAMTTLNSPSIFHGGNAPPTQHSPVLDPHHARDQRDQRDTRDLQRARFLDQGNSSNPKRIKLDQPESNRLPLIGPGSSPASRRAPTPLPAVSLPPPPAAPTQQAYIMNDFLANLDPLNVHPDLKKEGNDWFVMYNPKVKRTLDVSLIHTFAHETVVCCIQFSGDGKYLATGCNRTAQIYDVSSGRKICSLADEASTKKGDLYIRSVRFSPDGRFLATGAEDERIRIWDIEERSIRAVFEGHHQDIYSLDFSLDGRRLVSGSGDATVRVWDLELDALPPPSNGNSNGPPPHSTPLRILTAHAETPAPDDDAGVMSVALSPDASLVAAGCVDSLVRVWSLATGQLVEVLRGHTNSVHSVVWMRDGGGVVSGALDNTIRCWDLRSASGKGKVPCTVFAGHKDYVLSVGISRDAQWVVSGSKDRGVHFWDSAGVVQCMLQGHKNSVISTSLHPVGNLLATGSGDKLARIWNYSPV